MKSKQTIILDVDGIIFDSNQTKEKNILKAAKQFCEEDTAAKFARYFTRLNGVPRELKINKFFSSQPHVGQQVLRIYNTLNAQSLPDIQLTYRALPIIRQLASSYELVALSGGCKREIERLFVQKEIHRYFTSVAAGPADKTQNLEQLGKRQYKLYIGDSKVDYETARAHQIPFCFMYEYTQFSDWRAYFNLKNNVSIIKNLQQVNSILT